MSEHDNSLQWETVLGHPSKKHHKSNKPFELKGVENFYMMIALFVFSISICWSLYCISILIQSNVIPSLTSCMQICNIIRTVAPFIVVRSVWKRLLIFHTCWLDNSPSKSFIGWGTIPCCYLLFMNHRLCSVHRPLL